VSAGGWWLVAAQMRSEFWNLKFLMSHVSTLVVKQLATSFS
jgi:hypothetical protein